jgi:hypothetical protein
LREKGVEKERDGLREEEGGGGGTRNQKNCNRIKQELRQDFAIQCSRNCQFSVGNKKKKKTQYKYWKDKSRQHNQKKDATLDAII